MLTTIKSALRPTVRWLQNKATLNYTSGPEADNAISTASYICKLGYNVTIGYWNLTKESPQHVVSQHHSAITRLTEHHIPGYLSIKAPAFEFNHDSYLSLIEASDKGNIRLHFDSLHHEYTDATFRLIETFTERYQHVPGCTLPGRWQRSLADAEHAIQLGSAVRVVKGQWPDPDRPDTDPAKGFMAVIEKLAGKAQHVRVASHDPVLVKAALTRLVETDTPCELEVLYGLPLQHVIPIAASFAVPVRIYIPFGYAWLPYCISTVRKNPAILWWLFRDALGGNYLKRIPILQAKQNK